MRCLPDSKQTACPVLTRRMSMQPMGHMFPWVACPQEPIIYIWRLHCVIFGSSIKVDHYRFHCYHIKM